MTLVKFNEKINRDLVSPGYNDIFETLFKDSFISDRMISRVPAVNICETDDSYLIELGAPGLKKEDFKVNLDKNLLNISVEKQEEETDTHKQYNRKEYAYNSFVRSFALPDSADNGHIDAAYTDGVLQIQVAKKEEAKMTRKQISIK